MLIVGDSFGGDQRNIMDRGVCFTLLLGLGL